MSDPEQIPDVPAVMPAEGVPAVPDPIEAIRAQVAHEYAGKLAHAELRFQAAKDGVELPAGFTDFLDASKLVGDDGQPSAEAIGNLLEPFKAAKIPQYPQGIGLGRQGGYTDSHPTVSLDARNR
ncbi:hypothetical protein [Streptomyces sp. RKAG337]|uniref:hypothetical protein n=1 Tax=Streptomyces sp. RKAG337 TaxID=2893404 RepID=UPI0020346015|nr:hypothetical protein [Streptomyces sp. RKAG337]MCM2429348.1 hypothetical protein [Streptomyces sp. RKAG337]